MKMFVRVRFCSVYYLLATFGSATGDAVLDIPVSVTVDNIGLGFLYRISSLKIELSIWKSKAGSLHQAMFSETSVKFDNGEWNFVFVPLDSDVETVQLIAKKHVVTTTVEYILVKSLKLATTPDIPQGTTLLLHYIV